MLYFSRYDHLSDVLCKILDERPNNCVGELSLFILQTNSKLLSLNLLELHLLLFIDVFEDYSQVVKKGNQEKEEVRIVA
jgi:hypothetical protein